MWLSNNIDIGAVLLEYASQVDTTKSLVLNDTGQLVYRKLTESEKFFKFFGLGNASKKKIIDCLIQNTEIFGLLANTYKQKGEDYKIYSLQQTINTLFEKSGKFNKAPDLYLYINENWMENLPEDVQKKKMRELVIPGTHDSAAYQLNLEKTPKGKWKTASRWIRFFQFMGLKKLVSDFTLTQHYDLLQQLQLGARYFDFRVSYSIDMKKYYLTHTFACTALDVALSDIKQFMETHPKEIIILQIEVDGKHRAQFTSEQTDELLTILNDALGIWAVSHHGQNQINNFGDKSYKSLIDLNQRVLFGFPGETKIAQPSKTSKLKNIFWQSDLNNQGWLNAKSVKKGLEVFKQKIIAAQDDLSKMHSVASSLTPTEKEFSKEGAKRLFPFLKAFKQFKKPIPTTIERGRMMNQKLPPYFNTIEEKEENKFQGILYCDSPDRSNVFHSFIQQNHQQKKNRDKMLNFI